MTTPNYEHLLPPTWKTKISEWLQEDIPSFDYGGFVVGETDQVAILYGKTKVSNQREKKEENKIDR